MNELVGNREVRLNGHCVLGRARSRAVFTAGFGCRLVLAFVAVLGAGGPYAEAHPHHFARGEAVLNASTGHLEVSISVEADALAKAIRTREVGASTASEQSARARLVKYLESRFKTRTPAGWAKLKLAGWEPDGQRMWVHFEMLDVKRVHGLAVTCRLLFDVEPSQVNTLRLKAGAYGRSLVFDRDHPTRVVDATANAG